MMKMSKHLPPRTRAREALATLAIAGGALVAAAPALAATTNVNLTSTNQFDQSTVNVSEGDTVTFTWQGGFHDVVFADGVSSGTPVGIDGTTFSRTFDVAGTYDYVCSVHESVGMVGTVVVEGAAATTTVGAATDTTAAPAAESTQTTAAPSAAPQSGSSATTQPFTGPEQSWLPMFGVALAAGGIAIRYRLRHQG